MDFKIVDPLRVGEWDLLLGRFPKAGFFHSSAWCQTLVDAYGYSPFYVAAYDAGELKALAPMMEVDSWLTGRRGVGLPFTDICPVLLQEPKDWPEIWEELITYGRNRRWKYLELKGDDTDLFPGAKRTGHINHIVDLSRESGKLLERFRDSTRRNIQKAIKIGVIVRKEESYAALREYYRLHVITRKRHGIPPQPPRFFKALYQNILEKGIGCLYLAYRPGENGSAKKSIAGAIFLTSGDKAIFKFGASEADTERYRSNNMVMWTAMDKLQSEGFIRLDMGRTDATNRGLLHFKDGWGTTRQDTFYWNFNLEKSVFLEQRWNTQGFHEAYFSKLPKFVLKGVGSMIYRHVG